MFTLPSSRKLAYPALILLATAVVFRLLLELKDIATTDIVQRTIVRSSTQAAIPLNFSAYFNPNLSLKQQFVSNYHASHPLPSMNPCITRLFSRCYYKPNPHTNHVRLPSIHISNISMVPTLPEENVNVDEFTTNRYFNPTIIALPPHIYTPQTPYRYVLLTRLVTTGLHQESHVCFADICSPRSRSVHYSSARLCDASDLELLGANGGMRCTTTPEKLNIPPTPARNCSGTWRTFPDIPGFHDPRMFWTGRESEVLVEVNSGSGYGCVGLWVVDLRSVWVRLDEILKRSSRSERHEISEKSDSGAEEYSSRGGNSEKVRTADLGWLGAPLRYQYLTEITRNPRDSRSEVEKNWVLFFPNEDEMWVQYDLMGRVAQENREGKTKDGRGLTTVNNHCRVLDDHLPAADCMQEIDASTSGGDLLQNRRPNKREEILPETKSTSLPSPLESILQESGRTSNLSFSLSTSAPLSEPEAIFSIVTEASLTHQPSIRGGRTLSQLLNTQAYTTPNMTSPHEPPCFDYHSPTYLHDSLHNSGHWHQGSNSLRLILCTREELQQRSCLSDVAPTDPLSAGRSVTHAEKNATSWNTYERLLTNEGMVVHFSIIHRKFSNVWDLPMRYERYFLLWEARRPFRILGVSKYPILLENERARPWSWNEDIGWDMDQLDGVGESEGEHNYAEKSHEYSEIMYDENVSEPAASTVNLQSSATDQLEVIPQPAKDKRNSNQTGANDTRPAYIRDVPISGRPKMSQKHKDGLFYFTYTPSIAWNFRLQSSNTNLQSTEDDFNLGLGTGTLDDEIIVGVGLDDLAQGFAQVSAREVLSCLRFCHGVEGEDVVGDEKHIKRRQQK
ncbi:hypothetical protein H2198_009434 [Neophaeococcomyces mojaviensis]|uniref:Uncharacterized protein n=1 Tax=Neophaeococcomyces mojaviensis TaxID=3383035 RepID=A0ACC2ZUP1_9EURO|nr:hypothetical protein H2198_009434 [Knufia sp. JES_112]